MTILWPACRSEHFNPLHLFLCSFNTNIMFPFSLSNLHIYLKSMWRHFGVKLFLELLRGENGTTVQWSFCAFVSFLKKSQLLFEDYWGSFFVCSLRLEVNLFSRRLKSDISSLWIAQKQPSARVRDKKIH